MALTNPLAPEPIIGTGSIRIIARLDIKMEHLIKGVHLEGWRKVGAPDEYARRYYAEGADELLYMDVVASLYERNNLIEVVRSVGESVFVPVTVGGGIRTLDDVRALLSVGADKVAVNTAATRDSGLISSIADTYGSQATVLSIEAKRLTGGGWEAMTDNGRNHTGRDAVEWALEGEARGAGEILLTSIDRDGTRVGMDLELIRSVTTAVAIPVIASGGAGKPLHIVDSVRYGGASAVAVASAFHFGQMSIPGVREALWTSGMRARHPEGM